MDERITVIKAKKGWLNINLGELWEYRDLVKLLVRRTFVEQYRQTILGPAWAIIQPFLTTIVFTVVFGNIAKLAPDGVPVFAFYLAGSICWGYFSSCLLGTSSTLLSNSGLFGKVYFPRLVMPVSTVISRMISFLIQLFFLIVLLFIYFAGGDAPRVNLFVLMTPLLVVHMALLGMGFGLIISALTIKYRDLVMLVSFGVRLWMYASPVAYDPAIVPPQYMNLYMLNPITPVINTFRYAYLGIGSFQAKYYLISWAVTILVLFLGITIYGRAEKTFMDTV